MQSDAIEVVAPLGGGIGEVTSFLDVAATLAGCGVFVEPGRIFRAAVRCTSLVLWLSWGHVLQVTTRLRLGRSVQGWPGSLRPRDRGRSRLPPRAPEKVEARCSWLSRALAQ